MARSTNPFRYFDSSPEVIRTVVIMYVKFPLSLRNVEDLLGGCCQVNRARSRSALPSLKSSNRGRPDGCCFGAKVAKREAADRC